MGLDCFLSGIGQPRPPSGDKLWTYNKVIVLPRSYQVGKDGRKETRKDREEKGGRQAGRVEGRTILKICCQCHKIKIIVFSVI